MMRDWLVAALICLVSGLVLLYQAWRIKQGHNKWEFLTRPNPVVPKDGQYGDLPFGIGLLIAALGAFIAYMEDSGLGFGRVVFLIGFFGGCALAFAFMYWKPNWLKPGWLLWLEDRYDEWTIEFMFDQACRDGQWRKRTETDEGLKAWAEEMARRHGLERQGRTRL